jgi:hypothetical protein
MMEARAAEALVVGSGARVKLLGARAGRRAHGGSPLTPSTFKKGRQPQPCSAPAHSVHGNRPGAAAARFSEMDHRRERPTWTFSRRLSTQSARGSLIYSVLALVGTPGGFAEGPGISHGGAVQRTTHCKLWRRAVL